MSGPPTLTLSAAARAENVALVRQALAGVAETIGLDEAAVADLKTVVTEACMNAVVHAYEREDGPLDVAVWLDDEGLQLRVRDRGSGFRPRPVFAENGALRLGLPLIAALSDGFEISGAPGRGTEVRIRKRLIPEPETDEDQRDGTSEGTVLEFTPEAPVQPVLARVLGTLAARADLSIDRLSDVQMLGDAVSAQALRDASGLVLAVRIADAPGRLDLWIGPLAAGGAERLLDAMEIPGPPIGSLRELASEVRAERQPNGEELLVIAIAE